MTGASTPCIKVCTLDAAGHVVDVAAEIGIGHAVLRQRGAQLIQSELVVPGDVVDHLVDRERVDLTGDRVQAGEAGRGVP